jgi:hypothetical protein
MSQQLISRNPDLQRLRTEGYNIQIRAGHLILRDVPYVNAAKEVMNDGVLVSVLKPAGDLLHQEDHTVFFTGEGPCDADGKLLSKVIIGSATQERIKDYLNVNFQFSQKPKDRGKYDDHFEKMTTYVAMLLSHAHALDSVATAKTFRVDDGPDEPSVFHYQDSATSRAGIDVVSDKLKIGRVAIVGLGGTGSYVLDLVAKTPVREIHLFDGDRLWQHNAFRSPGAATLNEVSAGPLKVTYFANIYGRMHRHILAHEHHVDDETVGLLADMDFVFICVDRGVARRIIVEYLEVQGKSFIDVGMGIEIVDQELTGLVRVTASTPNKRDHLRDRASLGDVVGVNEYATNVQIADLNALNASLAVIKWKKLHGFYLDLTHEHFSAYSVNGNLVTNDDRT